MLFVAQVNNSIKKRIPDNYDLPLWKDYFDRSKLQSITHLDFLQEFKQFIKKLTLH